ncbi:MAG TPA: aldehyde dehydrogenase family protein [Thermodesulfobacteriota bacterium]|nr:aldehyde dehydrogenase family protein [Thermodesulfobacteriota bacterium]
MDSSLRKYGLFIDGKEAESVSGKTYVRENPATEEPFAEIAEARKEDVDKAVKAAKKAFEKWSHVPPSERAKIVYRIAELIEKKKDEIALTNTLETGKPIRESRLVELGASLRTMDYYAGAATKLNGESISVSDNQLTITLREPVGVVAHIIPWNFPLLLSFWKIAPALVAGCTIVLKPAELTPCGTMEVARVCAEAGLPDGVLNVIPGEGRVAGQALIGHPDVNKIAFTGSTEVGKIVMSAASRDIKKVSLELGGKAPCIVFDDAEIEEAVEANLRGGFFNQGENCTAVTRLLLHENIYDEFLSSYIDRVRKIRIGDPTKEETEMGSLISKEHFENVKSYFEKGVEEGGKVLCGGGRPKEFTKGYFFEPTVLADVRPSATVACDEIFGPVVAVMPFKTEEEAIRISNDTVYGLAGGIWTQNIKRAIRMAKAIKAGYLWVNTYGGIIPEIPYGGFKQSGIGKELGREGLDSYLETKAVNIYLGDKAPRWYKG